MKTTNDIERYMQLSYRVEVVRIPEEKGGGFMACLPQFGRMAAVGDGDTIEAAIADLEESKRMLFEEYIDQGLQIPEPDTFEEEYSGRFVVRVPKYLHRDLSMQAAINRTSLNQFVVSLLSRALKEETLSLALARFETEMQSLRAHICELGYKIESKPISPWQFIGYTADDMDRAA